MYSSDAPPSFTPAGMNSFDQGHLRSSATMATGEVYSPPPSQGHMGTGHGNSHNQFQEMTANRGLYQTNMTVDNPKAPSLTDMGHAQGNSYNQDVNINRDLGGNFNVSGAADGPLSFSDLMKGRASQTSDGGGTYKDGKSAPGLSDVDRRGTSETGPSATVPVDVPDAQEFVGISLVGNNFRKFYPNAYYKDDDN